MGLSCPWCEAPLAARASRCERCGRPIDSHGARPRRGAVVVPGSLRRTNDVVSVAIGLQTSLTTLLVATESLSLAMLALFAGLVVLTISAQSGWRTGALVESDRLTHEGSVVVLREHVARVVASPNHVRIDTVHGEVRSLPLAGSVDARQVVAELAAVWPELARWGPVTLHRVAERRATIALADLSEREPLAIEPPHRGEGYRDAGQRDVRVWFRGPRPWSVERDGAGVVVRVGDALTRRLEGPVVLVHATPEGPRLVTAADEMVVPSARERDTREAVRLLRRVFVEESVHV
jgi:hypothetical protein